MSGDDSGDEDPLAPPSEGDREASDGPPEDAGAAPRPEAGPADGDPAEPPADSGPAGASTGGDPAEASTDPDPPQTPAGPGTGATADDGSGSLGRYLAAESDSLALLREVLSSVLLVVLVAGLLFGVSGVWPPMVAVESESMSPHMHRGDLVFLVEEHRFAGDAAVEGTGVVPHDGAGEYDKFGASGDVIVYRPNGQTVGRPPIIHRAHFYVEEGENWYDRADQEHVRADSCEELTNCPAPNEGFITKGDNPRSNQYYDQAQGMSRPVKPAWIEGKAMVRVPGLGHIRLAWSELRAAAGSAALVLGVGLRRRQFA